jgi:hypothetical protein
VIVRALRIELVFDVHAGDAGTDAFSHQAHGVKRVAEACAAVDDERDGDALRDVRRQPDLLAHRELRLGDRGRRAADVAADVAAS